MARCLLFSREVPFSLKRSSPITNLDNKFNIYVYIYIYMYQPFVAHVNGIFDQLVLRMMIFSTVYREGSRLMLNLISELSQFKL